MFYSIQFAMRCAFQYTAMCLLSRNENLRVDLEYGSRAPFRDFFFSSFEYPGPAVLASLIPASALNKKCRKRSWLPHSTPTKGQGLVSEGGLRGGLRPMVNDFWPTVKDQCFWLESPALEAQQTGHNQGLPVFNIDFWKGMEPQFLKQPKKDFWDQRSLPWYRGFPNCSPGR